MTKQIIPVPPSVRKNLTGHQFGRLTVVGYAGKNHCNNSMWLCRCDCGNETVALGSNLGKGATQSCGKHHPKTANGMSKTPEYKAWHAMRRRCSPNSAEHKPYYHDRGITVCDRWANSFENFLADVGKRPSPEYTLDRIDNDKGYSPDNCRWASRAQQQNNRGINHRITFNGETRTVTQWASHIGISPHALTKRLRLGWPIEKAISTPINTRKQGRLGSHTSSTD